jgi:hypothetical protein
VHRHPSEADPDPEPNFNYDADPDPDRHQNADPHVDPTQSLTHVGKYEKNISFL